MANTNCLEGIRCPGCNQEARFVIAVSVFASVTDDGTDALGGATEWDDNSPITCPECNQSGPVGDFRLTECE